MNDYYDILMKDLLKQDIINELSKQSPENKEVIDGVIDEYFKNNEINFTLDNLKKNPVLKRRKGEDNQCIARVWLGGKKYKGYNDGSHQCVFNWVHEGTRCCDKHHEKILKNEWSFGKINEKLEKRITYKGKCHVWDLAASDSAR